MIKCPNCNYLRRKTDALVHKGICPQCGIAYAKYKLSEPTPGGQNRISESSDNYTIEEQITLTQRFIRAVLYIPDQVNSLYFYGRVALFILFFIWGIYFIVGGIDWERIGGSFLHNINLPFHEFGHVLFMPLGRFMTILGGSLFQIIMPIICTVVFVWKQKDNFAASITLWWTGQSFIDLSPYIADAPSRAIPLVGGMGEEGHDWGNLLTMTNSLDSAGTIAGLSFAIGTALILLSYAWGAYILWQQKQRLAD